MSTFITGRSPLSYPVLQYSFVPLSGLNLSGALNLHLWRISSSYYLCSLLALLAHLVGNTEPKLLRLVQFQVRHIALMSLILVSCICAWVSAHVRAGLYAGHRRKNAVRLRDGAKQSPATNLPVVARVWAALSDGVIRYPLSKWE